MFFFPLPFSALILLSPSNHHTVVHIHESFFLFAQPLHPLTSQCSCHLLSIYESVPIFLVSSVCELDSTHEWNHRVFVFSDWLISLSITSSRSIHTVTKGKIFYFFTAKYYSIVLSTHLLTDTWAASISWCLSIMLQWT